MALSYNSAAARPVLRRAGQLFGLNLLDLFTDEDSERGDFDPNLTFTATGRGRGYGLTYKPQQQSTISATLGFNNLPSSGGDSGGGDSGGGNSGGGDSGGGTTTPTIKTNYGQSDLFGGQDYIEAKNQGFTDAQIKDYLDKNPYMLALQNQKGQGGLYDQLVAGTVDTSRATTREYAERLKNFDPSAQTGEFAATQPFKEAYKYQAPQISTAFGQSGGYFGGEDLKAARQSGYSDADIRDFLNKNLELVRGPNAPGGSSEIGQLLKPSDSGNPTGGGGGGGGGGSSSPAPQDSRGNDIGFSAAGSNAGSENWFGGADIREAMSKGATQQDIQNALRKYDEAGKTREGMAKGGKFYNQIMAGDFSGLV